MLRISLYSAFGGILDIAREFYMEIVIHSLTRRDLGHCFGKLVQREKQSMGREGKGRSSTNFFLLPGCDPPIVLIYYLIPCPKK